MFRKSRTRFCFLIMSVLTLTLLTEAASVGAIPSPFFFTENKGQWDARVLYKCQAKNGMTWFL
ncbi:MAG: hypothetical protein OEM52_04540, partial [bacterium]|nr:hypothetical protein [bacterium]